MSGNLRRRLGREAIELGGNAVIGFRQCFDLENKEYCITARAVGTCVQLVPVSMLQSQTSPMESDPMLAGEGALAGSYHSGSGGQSSPTGFRAMPLATGTSSMAMTMEDAEPHPASTEDGSSPMQPANVEPSAAVTERVPSSFIPLSLVRNNSTIGTTPSWRYMFMTHHTPTLPLFARLGPSAALSQSQRTAPDHTEKAT